MTKNKHKKASISQPNDLYKNVHGCRVSSNLPEEVGGLISEFVIALYTFDGTGSFGDSGWQGGGTIILDGHTYMYT